MSLFEKNLAAVRVHVPVTAALVEAAAIPDGYEPATGTDETATFLRITTDPHQLHWLGNTSMPAASAEPLTADLDAIAATGLGLSIGTGYEWLALCRRLAPALPLYVYEPDAAQLRMALTICDLSNELATARIIIFSGTTSEAQQAMAAFLSSHLGHESPTVLHPLATLTPERRNSLLAAGEAIVRHGLHSRQGTVSELAARLQAGLGTARSGNEVAAIIGQSRYPCERPLHLQLPSEAPRLRLNDFASCSLALRLEFLLRHHPATIASDFFRGELACIPLALPVHTWMPPLPGPALWRRLPAPASLMPHDRIIVHAGVHQILLEAHGISAAQIECRPLALPHPAAAGELSPALAGNAGPRAIALIADLPRTDAPSLGLLLPTHQAIHAAAVDLIAADYLAVNFHSAPDILRRALVRAGVAPDSDSSLHESLLLVIRDILIPSIPLLTLARAFLDQRLPLQLIGDWPNLDRPVASRPFADFCNELHRWRSTAAVVHLSPWGNVSPILLDAAANHVPIIAPRHPSDAFAGALPALSLDGSQLLRPQPQQLFAAIKASIRR